MTSKLEGAVIQMNDTYIACHIYEFTDDLKNCIRNHLTNICHGKNLASQDLSLYSYKNTLSQFHHRYNAKTEEIKKGMMGELLAHVLIHEHFDDFDVISPFFNMEEKSQRKGFDLLLVSKSDEDIWITEVKSGETGQKNCPNVATRSFLHTAKRDLKYRLNQGEETFWLNAINTANTAIEDCNDYKDAIIQILDSEGSLAMNDESDSTDNNVILISVLYHDIAEIFDVDICKHVSESVTNEEIFKKVITFSIQKGTYQRIEAFLFEEELDGK